MASYGRVLGGKKEKLTRKDQIGKLVGGSGGEGTERIHRALTGPTSLKRSDMAVRK